MADGTRILFGRGAIEELPRELDADHDRMLAVFGASSAGRAWRKKLEKLSSEAWEHPTGSPTAVTVAEISGRIRACRPSLVLAAGGGGVLDAAKAAMAEIDPAGEAEAGPTLVTVPTTPGTGAEVTPFATIWDLVAAHKISIRTPSPVLAVIDPELCVGLPQPVLAASVLDALSQGVEASWSVRSTSASIRAGLTAVSLIAQGGERLFNPVDAGAMTVASLAGLWAGRAISVSQTTACHALSYPLTARYGVRHGHACILSLATMLDFNAGVTVADCVDRRGEVHVREAVARIVASLGEQDVAGACRRIEHLRLRSGLCGYAECGADSATLVREAVTYGRLSNNPRLLDEKALHILVSQLEN